MANVFTRIMRRALEEIYVFTLIQMTQSDPTTQLLSYWDTLCRQNGEKDYIVDINNANFSN